MLTYKHKVNKQNMDKKYYTVQELADLLGISRIAVFNRIKRGTLIAEKVGRNYVISRENVGDLLLSDMTDKTKIEIEKGVSKVLKDYRETIELLGKE